MSSRSHLTNLRRELHFIPLDPADGHILNKACWPPIGSEWAAPLKIIQESYERLCPDTLISIYVRGSVPIGRAIVGFSDIDTFAIVKKSIAPSRLRVFSLELNSAKLPATKADFQAYTWEEICTFPQLAILPFYIKTQSLLVSGYDFAREIQNFYPDQALVTLLRSAYLDILNVNRARIIERIMDPVWKSWLLRLLIRLAFTLNISQSRQYTRDVYTISTVLSAKFPWLQDQLHDAMINSIFPDSYHLDTVDFAIKFTQCLWETEMLNQPILGNDGQDSTLKKIAKSIEGFI